MITTKRVIVGVSIIFVAVMVYQWGHSDGREGKEFGLIVESIAAESQPKISPVKARANKGNALPLLYLSFYLCL